MHQAHGTFFRPVFQPEGFSIATWESKCHFLVGLRQPASAIEFHSARLDPGAHRLGRRRVACSTLRIRCAHQIYLHFATARYTAALPPVPAALGVNYVMAVSGLAEYG